MFQNLKNRASAFASKAAAVGAVALGVASQANAAVDVTAVKTAIDDTLTPIGLLGGAVLLVIVGVKTYKWIRRAM
jgi:hypothetical protein